MLSVVFLAAPSSIMKSAFGDGRLGVTPTITLHGRQFRYFGADTAPVRETACSAAQPVIPAISA
jgi:hypothetical protein